MARSIHTTYRQIARMRRMDYADPAHKAEELQRLWREIWRKRQIKESSQSEKRSARQQSLLKGNCQPDDLEALSIRYDRQDESIYAHHPVGPEELRAFLRFLPPGLGDLLGGIVLAFDNRRAAASPEDEGCLRDPLTGRAGYEIIPGVYCSSLLGLYRVKTTSICLYAYVYDSERLPLPLPLCELYLKLRTLTTFAHELAHHFDEMRRVARGRWLAYDKTLVECYAEEREYVWGRDCVVPFLEKRYPQEVKALTDWVACHGGVHLPLVTLAGEPRKTGKHGLRLMRGNMEAGFENWLLDRNKKALDLPASQLAFAWELHSAEAYEVCLQAVDRLLAEYPPTPEILTLKGDTLSHLERYDEAEVCLRGALELDPDSLRAWVEIGRVVESRKDWSNLLVIAEHTIAVAAPKEDGAAIFSARRFAAVACCALDQTAQVEIWIAKMTGSTHEEARGSRRYHLRRQIYRRAGKPLSIDQALL